jgi:hypothetical protein
MALIEPALGRNHYYDRSHHLKTTQGWTTKTQLNQLSCDAYAPQPQLSEL